jgi:hypothetical protein
MKKWIVLSALGIAAAGASLAASAHVDLNIGIGLPGVVAAPPPVVYAQPAYAPPPPVVYYGGDRWHRPPPRDWHHDHWDHGHDDHYRH